MEFLCGTARGAQRSGHRRSESKLVKRRGIAAGAGDPSVEDRDRPAHVDLSSRVAGPCLRHCHVSRDLLSPTRSVLRVLPDTPLLPSKFTGSPRGRDRNDATEEPRGLLI